jgi:hypothetical protein
VVGDLVATLPMTSAVVSAMTPAAKRTVLSDVRVEMCKPGELSTQTETGPDKRIGHCTLQVDMTPGS